MAKAKPDDVEKGIAEYDENGKLTRESAELIIKGGGSVYQHERRTMPESDAPDAKMVTVIMPTAPVTSVAGLKHPYEQAKENGNETQAAIEREKLLAKKAEIEAMLADGNSNDDGDLVSEAEDGLTDEEYSKLTFAKKKTYAKEIGIDVTSEMRETELDVAIRNSGKLSS